MGMPKLAKMKTRTTITRFHLARRGLDQFRQEFLGVQTPHPAFWASKENFHSTFVRPLAASYGKLAAWCVAPPTNHTGPECAPTASALYANRLNVFDNTF